MTSALTFNLEAFKTIFTDLHREGKLMQPLTLRYCCDKDDILGFYARVIDSVLVAHGICTKNIELDADVLNGYKSRYSIVKLQEYPTYGITFKERDINDVVNAMFDDAYSLFSNNDNLRLQLIELHDSKCESAKRAIVGNVVMGSVNIENMLDGLMEALGISEDQVEDVAVVDLGKSKDKIKHS